MSPEPQLTGMAKTFNSVTFTGRANVAKATYAGEPMCKCYILMSELSFFFPEIRWCNDKVWNDIFSGIILIVAAVKAKNYIKAQ